MLTGREQFERRVPLALELGVPAQPAEGLGQLEPGFGRPRLATYRFGPEPGRLRHRAERARVPGGLLPAGPGQIVAAGPAQVAGHLGGDLAAGTRGRLDGKRELFVAPPLFAEVGTHRLGEQRMSEPQAAAAAVYQSAVQRALLGVVPVRDR